MENEDKFLNKEYLTTRLRDFKEIKSGQVTFGFKDSDREYSNTIYVCFYIQGQKRAELRISDHLISKAPQIQFIVNPSKTLTKKKKELFVKAVNNVLNKARVINLQKKIDFVAKKMEQE